MARDRLSIAEARRIALAAQGFDRPRPDRAVTARDVRRIIHLLGLIQLDFVNVLAPAHYQVLFARLGPYRRSIMDKLVYKDREFTEQWAHEASIVPMDMWPLLRYRRETHRVRLAGFERFLIQYEAYVSDVLTTIRDKGSQTAEDFPDPEGVSPEIAGPWYGRVARAVLEYHFARGAVAVASRKSNMARMYDVPERVIPPGEYARIVSREEAERELIRRAARAYGIATEQDLADYFRMPVKDCRARIHELREAGELRAASVEGWRETAYLHREASLPRRIEAASLLSPFDPVVWFRPRASRLFDFEYRIEIYTPEPQRKWGYYVLPFLLDERIVGRFDLKADRARGVLVVRAAYVEPHALPEAVAPAVLAELRLWAEWLDLHDIAVEPRGNLAAVLAHASLS